MYIVSAHGQLYVFSAKSIWERRVYYVTGNNIATILVRRYRRWENTVDQTIQPGRYDNATVSRRRTSKAEYNMVQKRLVGGVLVIPVIMYFKKPTITHMICGRKRFNKLKKKLCLNGIKNRSKTIFSFAETSQNNTKIKVINVYYQHFIKYLKSIFIFKIYTKKVF